jgi:hypothetical protein
LFPGKNVVVAALLGFIRCSAALVFVSSLLNFESYDSIIDCDEEHETLALDPLLRIYYLKPVETIYQMLTWKYYSSS